MKEVMLDMGQVSIEVTQWCPNRCVHCSSMAGPDCVVGIPFDTVAQIIDDMPKIHMDLLCISGGEPLSYERVCDVIRCAKQKGITVYVYTSGIVCDEKGNICGIDKGGIRDLKQSGVDRLVFDLPAVDDAVYDKFMGTSGRLCFVKESIGDAIDAGIFTDVHFVPTKINLSQVDSVLAYA